MLNARNGRLKLKTGEMDYIRFGTGEKTLVMIPGVGDGLKTVKGMALPFAFLYRSLVKDFTAGDGGRSESGDGSPWIIIRCTVWGIAGRNDFTVAYH